MLALHVSSRIGSKLLTIYAIECRLWRLDAYRMVKVMQFHAYACIAPLTFAVQQFM